MDPLHVPLAAGALLLLPSGVQKLLHPLLTHRALQLTGVPSHPAAVRALGATELTIGAGTLVLGAWGWPAALAVLYAGFAAFVVLALWRGSPLSSCGCFGAVETPPTPLHAGITAAVSAVAVLAAVDRPGSPLDAVRDGGAGALGVITGSVFVTAVLYYALTAPGRRRQV